MMMEDSGRLPTAPGHSAEPEPCSTVSAVPASVPSAALAIDEWCKRRAERLSESAGQHIMGGKSLNAPNYRTLLGEHRAYLAVRSFIHGSLLASGMETRQGGDSEAAPSRSDDSPTAEGGDAHPDPL